MTRVRNFRVGATPPMTSVETAAWVVEQLREAPLSEARLQRLRPVGVTMNLLSAVIQALMAEGHTRLNRQAQYELVPPRPEGDGIDWSNTVY